MHNRFNGLMPNNMSMSVPSNIQHAPSEILKLSQYGGKSCDSGSADVQMLNYLAPFFVIVCLETERTR